MGYGWYANCQYGCRIVDKQSNAICPPILVLQFTASSVLLARKGDLLTDE